MKIVPQSGIMEIQPYQGGASQVEGVQNIVKLSSNENPFGPSEDAVEAFRRTSFDLHRYPSTDHATLREAISEVHGLDAGRIVCGVGSDEIISLLCQGYAGPGDEVIHTEHGFSMYRISALAAGASPIEVAERERMTDVNAILAACTENTRMVFIANPNNPTGTMIGDGEVARLAEKLPEHVLLVLDGAYAEYIEGYDGGAALVDRRENVVMTRTFSKLYGSGRVARWLGLWTGTCCRCSQPYSGAFQSVSTGTRRGSSGGPRRGICHQMPIGKHPAPRLARRGFGRARGVIRYLYGQLCPCAVCIAGRGAKL